MATPETERGPQLEGPTQTSESPAVADKVLQPIKMDLADVLGDIEEKISEAQSRGPGEQWSDGSSQGAQGDDKNQKQSARDMAIASIPAPEVMQKQLQQHILKEIKDLRKQAKKIQSIKTPGAAYRFSILMGKIHQLRKLMQELKEISVEAVRRLFIRIFIDKQKIIK